MRNTYGLAAGLAALLFSPFYLVAQHLSWGAIGGTSLTRDFNSTSYDYTFPPPISFNLHQDYLPADHGFPIGGLAVEWRFNNRFSIEADGIFRELHYKIDGGGVPISVVTWEVPVIGKYRFSSHSFGHTSFRPFVEAGPSYRTTGNLNGTDPSHIGFTAGGGIDIPVHGYSLAPTIRYTRWQTDGSIAVIGSRPDQFEFLVGFTHAAAFDRNAPFPFSIGGFVGTNLLGDYRTSVYGDFIQYTIINRSGPHSLLYGGQVQLRLPHHLAIEGDVLNRNAHSYSHIITQTTNGVILTDSGPQPFNLWQFPVLMKWTAPAKVPLLGTAWKPLLEAGPSFRLPIGVSRFGFTAGLGLDHPLGKFTFEPVFRYTRWQSNRYNQIKEDELDLMVGLRF